MKRNKPVNGYEKIIFLPIIFFLLINIYTQGEILLAADYENPPAQNMGTVFSQVRPDLLSPTETQHAQELSEAFQAEKWRDGIPAFQKLTVLYRDKLMPEKIMDSLLESSPESLSENISPGTYLPVSAFCQKILAAYADRMPEEIHRQLQKKWAFFNENEDSETETPEAETPETKKFRVTMTRIFDENGKILYQDPLPEELWKSLLPADTQGLAACGPELSADVTEISFPTHVFYSPKTHVLYARVGTPVSMWDERDRDRRPQGYFLALDMRAEGRLLWIKRPESAEWSFAGNPLADEKNVYIPMVRQASSPEFYLAALNRRDGAYVWRRFLFSAPADSSAPMIYHLPISQDDTHLQVGNQNTGVEVLLRKSDGKITRMNLPEVK